VRGKGTSKPSQARLARAILSFYAEIYTMRHLSTMRQTQLIS
jgi:hypothetical protein